MKLATLNQRVRGSSPWRRTNWALTCANILGLRSRVSVSGWSRQVRPGRRGGAYLGKPAATLQHSALTATDSAQAGSDPEGAARNGLWGLSFIRCDRLRTSAAFGHVWVRSDAQPAALRIPPAPTYATGYPDLHGADRGAQSSWVFQPVASTSRLLFTMADKTVNTATSLKILRQPIRSRSSVPPFRVTSISMTRTSQEIYLLVYSSAKAVHAYNKLIDELFPGL